MQHQSFKKDKEEKIERREQTIDYATIISIALMINFGLTGLIKSLVNSPVDPITITQMITDSTTLIVNMLFIGLNIIAVYAAQSKKHHELSIKEKELQHNGNKSSRNHVIKASLNFLNTKKITVSLEILCNILYAILGFWSIKLKINGDMTHASLLDIASYSFYSLAICLILSNKIIGSKVQNDIEVSQVNN